MNIYFNASVSAKKVFLPSYEKIVTLLEGMGHEVVADHVLDYPMSQRYEETPESRKEYYQKMKKRIHKCDLMVAEISFPSTVHVGHELTLAMDLNKPVLALHQKDMRPILFWGLEEEKFLVQEYTDDSLTEVLKTGLDALMDQVDTRFNFFISPKIGTYLDSISKKKRVPRAVYLRRLIEEDMRKNGYEE